MLGRLIQATSKSSGQVSTYQYDPFGRRSAKNVNGTVTNWIYAGQSPVAEENGSGTLLRRFLPGAGGEMLAVADPLNNRFYLHADGQGSVVAVSGTAGRINETHAYTAEGLQAAGPAIGSAASLTPFGYGGLMSDAETGLTHNRARAYSPRLGRFLQTDPAGIQGGLNLYAYAGGDPVDNSDPMGLYTLQIGLGGSINLPFGVTIPLGFGVALDTSLNIGLYSYGGAGAQAGADVEAGLNVQASNAKNISDLRGIFYNVGFHAGAGVGGSLDYFRGDSDDGPVTGGGFTVGAAAGASLSGGFTYTSLYAPFGDGRKNNYPAVGNTLQFGRDSINLGNFPRVYK
ncbi:MAG TPA: RHS repeat-associated core domain-containing protein [Dongiaceae bacterium]|nr:RHS repeat-associated core domain-containing protein [Dongiaceae bacterium]